MALQRKRPCAMPQHVPRVALGDVGQHGQIVQKAVVGVLDSVTGPLHSKHNSVARHARETPRRKNLVLSSLALVTVLGAHGRSGLFVHRLVTLGRARGFVTKPHKRNTAVSLALEMQTSKRHATLKDAHVTVNGHLGLSGRLAPSLVVEASFNVHVKSLSSPKMTVSNVWAAPSRKQNAT